jgi:O-antigen/teichoic acid export membrane protein
METRTSTGGPADPAGDAEARRRAEIEGGESGLRGRAARGTILNSGFMIGLFGLGMLQRLVVAAFLTREEFGIWGIVLTTLLALSFLKQVGISDKYVQQSEPDQEVAFQKAFSLELVISFAFFALVAAVLPLYGLAYGHSEIVLPGIVLGLTIPATAFETPFWIPFRRMQFVRQRTLSSVDPVTAFAVTIVLAVAGAGYWSLVIGTVAGSVVGGIVGVLTCPYRLRFRLDRATVREYAGFSLPLLGYGISSAVVVQGAMLVGNWTVGLAGLGAIALASSISSFADRVDGIVSQTIYPAVCAVAGRRELMYETFLKSNRLALMWGMPFGVGLALFAPDIAHFALGKRWESTAWLLGVIGLLAGFRQIGFNWTIFMRAVNNTRPMFVASLFNVATFALVAVPCIIAFHLPGYAIGMASMSAVAIGARGYYMARLFPGFRIFSHILRAIAPSVPAAGVVLLVRALEGGERTAVIAAGEVVLYVVATAIATFAFERALLGEMIGYLRKGLGKPGGAAAAAPEPAAPQAS